MQPNFFFYLSSFFTDKLVFQGKSSYNTNLQVVLSNGKHLLNAGKANYSFGNLHTTFQLAFFKTGLKNKKINNTLILGFGAGSVAHILRNELKLNCHITGVEIDESVIRLAEKYFHLAELRNCKISIADAHHYLENSSEKYDLIAVDLFLEMDVPDKFCSDIFLKLLAVHLQKGASLYFNFVADSTKQKLIFDALEQKFQTFFPNTKTFSLMQGNKILFSELNS